jgi:hypothetical protein
MNPDFNLDLDITFAKVVTEQFDDYVHAGALFYPVGSMNGMQMPQLTIGTWLETAWRLSALSAAPDVLAAAQAEVRKVRSRAQDMYLGLSRREFKSRLDSWEMFLDDRSDGGKGQAQKPFNVGTGYPTQVHIRFKLELLKDDVSQMGAQLSRLKLCDGRLRVRFQPGAFVWDAALTHAAPEEKYWWLYGA